MKKVLAFDVDQTLNVAKTPIDTEMARILLALLSKGFLICPISGQKFDQFLVQIVNPLRAVDAKVPELEKLHLFVAQGTQYYRYEPNYTELGPVKFSVTTAKTKYSERNWRQVYSYPLDKDQVRTISSAIETAARELGFWEADKLQAGDEIIENRLSQVTFSALGQTAGTKEKYAWDPDCKKREQIVARARELAPDFEYEIGGTTSINAFVPGMNKVFGMTHLMKELKVKPSDILYFGDMTQPGGNDYPVVEMGIDTITVRDHHDTALALRAILGYRNALPKF